MTADIIAAMNKQKVEFKPVAPEGDAAAAPAAEASKPADKAAEKPAAPADKPAGKADKK